MSWRNARNLAADGTVPESTAHKCHKAGFTSAERAAAVARRTRFGYDVRPYRCAWCTRRLRVETWHLTSDGASRNRIGDIVGWQR